MDVAADLMHIRTEIARRFEHQHEEIHKLAQEDSQRSFKRLLKVQERLEKQQTELNNKTQHELYQVMYALRQYLSLWLGVTLVVVVALALGLGYQLYSMQEQAIEANARLATSQQAVLEESRSTKALMRQVLTGERRSARRGAQSLDPATLSWALNSDWRFDYDQTPLGEAQVAKLSKLLELLSAGGYTGKVTLTVHFGNICLQKGKDGSLGVAAGNTPYGNCLMYADTRPSFTLEDLLSIAYVDFRAGSSAIQNGLIDLQLLNAGLEKPLVAYPKSATTAAEWNAIAQQNNRISINLAKF